MQQYLDLLKDIKENPLKPSSGDLMAGVSLGVAQYIIDETPQDFVKRADEALYQAKNSGRGTIAVSLANIR